MPLLRTLYCSVLIDIKNISFNDTDSIVKYDTKAKPSNTPEPENVTAPKTIERLEEISHVRNEQRKLEEAEEYTRQAIKLKPDFAEAHSNLGNILRGEKKLIEAKKKIDEAKQNNIDMNIEKKNE